LDGCHIGVPGVRKVVKELGGDDMHGSDYKTYVCYGTLPMKKIIYD
jgi:hypothetical protein